MQVFIFIVWLMKWSHTHHVTSTQSPKWLVDTTLGIVGEEHCHHCTHVYWRAPSFLQSSFPILTWPVCVVLGKKSLSIIQLMLES